MNSTELSTKPEAPAALCSSDLLACPHCGETYVSLLTEIPGGGCQVMCRGCGARSAVGKEMNVITEWNRRMPDRDTLEAIELGRKWQENSALEEWFPLTAEELTRLRELARLVNRYMVAPEASEQCAEAFDDLRAEWAKQAGVMP